MHAHTKKPWQFLDFVSVRVFITHHVFVLMILKEDEVKSYLGGRGVVSARLKPVGINAGWFSNLSDDG